jgi:hypothetical protein
VAPRSFLLLRERVFRKQWQNDDCKYSYELHPGLHIDSPAEPALELRVVQYYWLLPLQPDRDIGHP